MKFNTPHFILTILLAFAFIAAPIANAQTVPIRTIPRITKFTCAVAVGDQTNQTYITITPKDQSGNPIPGALFLFYVSDSPNGQGLTATASSGTMGTLTGTGAGTTVGQVVATSIGTSTTTSGIVNNVDTSKKILTIQANGATGTARIGIIDSAKTLYFPVVQAIRENAAPTVCTKLTAANYL